MERVYLLKTHEDPRRDSSYTTIEEVSIMSRIAKQLQVDWPTHMSYDQEG